MPYWSPKWLYKFALPPQWRSVLLSPHTFQHNLSLVFFILATVTGVRWYLRLVLICIFLGAKDVEQFLKCLSIILDSSIADILFSYVLHFSLDYLVFWSLASWVLCIFWWSVLCQMWGWWRSFPILWAAVLSVNCALCLTEASQFLEVPFINCWSQCLCYWCYVQEAVSFNNLFKDTSHFLF